MFRSSFALVLMVAGSVAAACGDNSDPYAEGDDGSEAGDDAISGGTETSTGGSGTASSSSSEASSTTSTGSDTSTSTSTSTSSSTSSSEASGDGGSTTDSGGDGDTGDEPGDEYLVGAGVYDITGPAMDVGMMGYAMTDQTTQGIMMRLRARAFIMGDETSRVVFVNADLGQIFIAVKQGVAAKLAADPELAEFYGDDNVLLSATHTHSGPGGYSNYFLYNFTVGGLVEQNYDVIVDGIYQAIKRAHANLEPGHLYLARGRLDEAGWQRSTLAYLANPTDERDRYADGDTDKQMTLLKFTATDGRDLGSIAWFAVHPTAMSPFNRLVNGDIHGFAEYLWERENGADYSSASTFVGAFAQSNAGDVSPNIKWGVPDGSEDFAHMEEIGTLQAERARSLYAAAKAVRGPIDFVHRYVDMSDIFVESALSTTCVAAMGASFAAGSTEDNVSPAPLYDEGVTTDDLTITQDIIGAALQLFFAGATGLIWPDALDPAYVACQGKKPILIPVGAGRFEDQPLTPPVLPLQLFRIGQFAIVAQPTEITTMAGRRLRNSVLDVLAADGVEMAVIAGLSNAYASYVTTPEEYDMQHYEGAGTHFGPNTLPAYQQEFTALAEAMLTGLDPTHDAVPPDLSATGFRTEVSVDEDAAPDGKTFGEVEVDAAATYAVGDTVEVVFWGGYPNHDPKVQGSYLAVETEDGTLVADDSDPFTSIRWTRDGLQNRVSVQWTIREDVAPGRYRIRHEGHAKPGGTLTPYEGVSAVFEVQ